MGRPKIEIDGDLVAKLARIHCTSSEIAAVVGCSVDTLDRRFAEEIAKGREEGKSTLRQGLWDLARKGNLGALIWLSKNHLGMSEKIESKNETAGTLVVQSVEERKERLQKALLNLKALDDK